MIDGASFGPEALKVVGATFDANNFGSDPAAIEAGRLQLAEAVLSVAGEDSRDVEALKRGAIEAMALYDKSPREPSPSLRAERQ
jgi:hypothetical protein